MREKEMRGLEQFFGMGIADKAQASATSGVTNVVGTVKAKLGFGEEAAQPNQEKPAIGGFPTAGAAMPVSRTATPAPAAGSAAAKPTQPPATGRDWSKMLVRVRQDVDRICDFLEALAKHPRGLQKYHEETVRTVHDSWLDREGEQSLRRWVRSECARIWPQKFAAIEAEKDRARADIAALEELFSGASNQTGG
jgi:hypothetical protein